MEGKISMAVGVTYQTMVGSWGDFPREHGNCFGVEVDGREYRVVNFIQENLAEAIKRGITWPIKVKLISERHAVIHDERIPDSWYSKEFCEVCCPKEMLPVNQLLRHDRQIARGERKETPASGRIPGMITIDTSKAPRL